MRQKNYLKHALVWALTPLFLFGFTSVEAANKSKVVIKGSDGPAGSVNGIDFDTFNPTNHNLYCTSTNDSKVFIIDSLNGDIIDVFGTAEGVVGPDDVAVGPDGQIYYTDTLAGAIVKIDPVTRLSTLVAFNLPLINSIRFSTDGTQLFAGQCFSPLQNGLWEIDLTGFNNNRLISDTLDLFSSLNSFEYRNGFIYGPRILTGDVVRVDPDDGTYEIVSSGFINPSAVQFDSQGQLYVIDTANNKLYKIENPESNNQIAVFIAEFPGNNGIDNLAIDKGNNDLIFVSSGNDGYILAFDPVSEKIVDYPKEGGLVLPEGITITSDGKFLVGDFNSLREIDINSKKVVKSVSTKIDLFTLPTTIIRPLSIAAFGNHVAIADWFARAIQIWDHNNDIALFRIIPDQRPINVLEHQGDLIVAEFDSATFTSSLVKYDAPNFTTKTTLLSVPFAGFAGLASDGTFIYISDAFSGNIYKFGAFTFTVVASGLVSPEGITLDTDGNHLIAIEVGTKQLVSIDLLGIPGSNVSTIEENLAVGFTNFAPGFFYVSSVVVDPSSNDIFYTADLDREVRRFKR